MNWLLKTNDLNITRTFFFKKTSFCFFLPYCEANDRNGTITKYKIAFIKKIRPFIHPNFYGQVGFLKTFLGNHTLGKYVFDNLIEESSLHLIFQGLKFS